MKVFSSFLVLLVLHVALTGASKSSQSKSPSKSKNSPSIEKKNYIKEYEKDKHKIIQVIQPGDTSSDKSPEKGYKETVKSMKTAKIHQSDSENKLKFSSSLKSSTHVENNQLITNQLKSGKSSSSAQLSNERQKKSDSVENDPSARDRMENNQGIIKTGGNFSDSLEAKPTEIKNLDDKIISPIITNPNNSEGDKTDEDAPVSVDPSNNTFEQPTQDTKNEEDDPEKNIRESESSDAEKASAGDIEPTSGAEESAKFNLTPNQENPAIDAIETNPPESPPNEDQASPSKINDSDSENLPQGDAAAEISENSKSLSLENPPNDSKILKEDPQINQFITAAIKSHESQSQMYHSTIVKKGKHKKKNSKTSSSSCSSSEESDSDDVSSSEGRSKKQRKFKEARRKQHLKKGISRAQLIQKVNEFDDQLKDIEYSLDTQGSILQDIDKTIDEIKEIESGIKKKVQDKADDEKKRRRHKKKKKKKKKRKHGRR